MDEDAELFRKKHKTQGQGDDVPNLLDENVDSDDRMCDENERNVTTKVNNNGLAVGGDDEEHGHR